MVLEDEEGGEFDVVYIGKRTGLSGGWQFFSTKHDLEDGDSLVFELVEPDRFKVLFLPILSLIWNRETSLSVLQKLLILSQLPIMELK